MFVTHSDFAKCRMSSLGELYITNSWCHLRSDYIRRIIISDLYSLLWTFTYIMGGGGQQYVLIMERFEDARRAASPDHYIGCLRH